MDTLLYGGDHWRDARGVPVSVEGERELLQRALIHLQVKKGSFAQDPALGSELYKLRRSESELNNRMALSYVQEALAPMKELRVTGAVCRLVEPDHLRVEVSAEIAGSYYQLEVGV